MTTTQRAPDRPVTTPARGPFGAMGMGPPQKAKAFKSSARRLIGRLASEKRGVLAVVLLALIGVSLSLSGPYLLGKGTDIIFRGWLGTHGGAAGVGEAQHVVDGAGIDFGALANVLTLVLLLYISASLFMWLQAYVLNIIANRVVFKLRTEVQAKLDRLPLSYFDTQPRGELLSRVTNDIDNVAQSMSQTLSQILNGLLNVLGILVMIFVLSPLLSLILLVTIPLSVMTTARIGKRAQKRFVAQWKQVGVLNGQIEEAFTGHSLVRVFGRRREFEAKLAATNNELYQASFRAQFISSIIMPAIQFIGNINYVVLAVVGGIRIASGTISLGSLQAFIQYTRQFSQQLGQLASMANVLQSGVASAERVFELIDTPDQRLDAPGTELDERATGEVVFDHVGFRYKPDQPLIEELSLIAKPGQTIAIVGPTGAGKTTLVNLLMRFYDLDNGRILLDGVDIATVPRAAIRAQIGMVLQDTWLFHGTIRENIAYGRIGATADEVVAAAKATYVDRFVAHLPDGYDTMIDEEASNVSSGEKQLLTIARAFLMDPAILVLDEATSSVDTRTEVLVQQAMAALRADRTSFVIAHRLSTIRDANLILVMENGQIVEQGSHTELLAKGGAYHKLYNAQFAAPTS